jgi:hypothetical protein
VPLVIPNETQILGEGITMKKLNLNLMFTEDKISTIEDDLSELNGILDKSWIITFYHDEYCYNFGPHSSSKIFFFLKNMYINLPHEDKVRKNFMVVDYVFDVHFQPDTLYELLLEEYKKKSKMDPEEKARQSNCIQTKCVNLNSQKRQIVGLRKAIKKTGKENSSSAINRKPEKPVKTTKEILQNVLARSNRTFTQDFESKSNKK